MDYEYICKIKIELKVEKAEKEIKLGVIYEGWCKRPGTKDFKELREDTLAEMYKVDEIGTRIINDDGATWIRASVDV